MKFSSLISALCAIIALGYGGVVMAETIKLPVGGKHVIDVASDAPKQVYCEAVNLTMEQTERCPPRACVKLVDVRNGVSGTSLAGISLRISPVEGTIQAECLNLAPFEIEANVGVK